MKLMKLFSHQLNFSPIWMLSLLSVLPFAAWAEEGSLYQSGSYAAPKSEAKPTAQPKDWKKQTESSCGIACRYSRASENLTLQAVYLMKKIQAIDTAIEKGEENSARIALGNFCKSADEDISDCFNRYNDFQRVGLLEIRQGIGEIDILKKNLIDGVKVDGTAEGTSLVYDGPEKTAYVPDIPTLAELEESYLKGNLRPSRGKYSADDIKKWSQELVINDPKSRYLKFSKGTVEGNPYQKEKTSYRLYIGDNPGGRRGVDDKAVGLYEKSRQSVMDFSKRDNKLDPSAKPIAPLATKKEDSLSYEAYRNARNSLNSKIEGDLKKEAPAEKSKGRSVAGSKDSLEADKKSDSDKSVSGAAKDIDARDRAPSAVKPGPKQADDYKIPVPDAAGTSHYIKYNVDHLLEDIEKTTADK